MASKAPFGTDLQPDFNVKIIAGRVVHVSQETQVDNLNICLETESGNQSKSKQLPINVYKLQHAEPPPEEKDRDYEIPEVAHIFQSLSASELKQKVSDIITACEYSSVQDLSSAVLQKQTLLKILSEHNIPLSEKAVDILVTLSDSAVDNNRILYAKFLETMKYVASGHLAVDDVHLKTDESKQAILHLYIHFISLSLFSLFVFCSFALCLPLVHSPAGDSFGNSFYSNSLSSSYSHFGTRLAKTCPPDFFTLHTQHSVNPVNTLRPLTDLRTYRNLFHNSIKRQSEGFENLFAALQKCSTITGQC